MPINPFTMKLMIAALCGMIALSPMVNVRNNRVQKVPTIIKKQPDKIETPYTPKSKKKLPFTAGYKPGKNPLPGQTPAQTYINAWETLKKELGL